MKNKNKLHSSVTILALTVASIFGELYSVDINAAPTPTPTPTPRPNYKRTKFTSEEDEKLRELVEVQRISDWGLIANNMPERSPRQCRERYLNYLSPNANVALWTVEEDILLLEKRIEFGPKWPSIAKYFQRRNEIELKNRYLSIKNKLIQNGKTIPSSILENLEQANNQQQISDNSSLNYRTPRELVVYCLDSISQTEYKNQSSQEIEDEAPIQIPQQASINSPLAFRPPMVAPDIDLSNTNPQTEHEDNLPKKQKRRKNKASTSNLPPLPIINLQQASIPAPRINVNTPQEQRTLQNFNAVIEIDLTPQIMEDNEIPTFHLLPTTPDLIPQIENRNQLSHTRREEIEDQTLTFDPILTMPTINRQERPNLLPTFHLLEEPDFYSSNMGPQMRNENQFPERESGVPSFYGLSIPPLQQHRLFDDSLLANTNDQEEALIMGSHNSISSRPQRLLDFDDLLAPSNFQPQHRLFDMSLDIDPSSTNAENQDEDSSGRRFPSLFDNSNSFRPKKFRDFDDFL